MRRDKLIGHCRRVHQQPLKEFCHGQEVKKSIYKNFDQVLAKPEEVSPIKDSNEKERRRSRTKAAKQAGQEIKRVKFDLDMLTQPDPVAKLDQKEPKTNNASDNQPPQQSTKEKEMLKEEKSSLE